MFEEKALYMVGTFFRLISYATFLFIFSTLSYASDSIGSSVDSLLKKADLFRPANPDTSLYILDQALEISLSKNDTIRSISILTEDKKINSNLGRYHTAYQKLWQIILLAEEAKLDDQRISAYIQLGRLFGYLDRKDQTLEYINKAQVIIEKRIKSGELEASSLIMPYYAKAEFYDQIENYEQVEIYLDSCNQVHQYSLSIPMNSSIAMVKTKLLIHENKCLEAIEILNGLLNIDNEILKHFYVMAKTAEGDAKLCLGQNRKAIKSYEAAIEYALQNNSHLDFSVLVHEKLSKAYETIGQHQSALQFSRKGQVIDYNIFDSRSPNNVNLFKIQDELRAFKEKQRILVQKQKLTDLENEEKLFSIKIWSLLLGLVLVSLIGFLTYKVEKQKQKTQERLNEELQQKIKREEEYSFKIKAKNKDLMMFSNIMSHDLKSPLRTIHSFASLMQQKAKHGKLSESIETYLNYITKSASGMSELIDDLLTYSRLEIDGINPELIDLNQFIKKVTDLFTTTDEHEKSTFEIRPLPSINGDKTLLKTVFHNVISNGLKYQPNGSENHTPRIRIWSEQKQNNHNIFIADNGIGISEDYSEKLFVPFNRYHSKSDYEGTGLGLSISKRIMHKHKGDINLDSSSELGSTFKIRFPNKEST